jgi:hypothetical protein
MLKFFFWILLFANAGLFAYQRGYLEMVAPSGREPARMTNQLNADKLKLIPAAQAESISAKPSPNEAVVAEAPKTEVLACVEIGNFDAEEAERFKERLAALSLGDRISQRSIREVLSHMVFIPPQGDKEGAEKKAGELRQLGVNDFYIVQDNSSMRWAISLGVFKVEEKARAQLVYLNRKGVRSARIGPYSMAATMVAFQLNGLDTNLKADVDKIKADFSRQEMRSCEAA